MQDNQGPVVVTEALIESASLEQLADMVRGLCSSYRRLLESITAERKLYEHHTSAMEATLITTKKQLEVTGRQFRDERYRANHLQQVVDLQQYEIRKIKRLLRKPRKKPIAKSKIAATVDSRDAHMI